MYIFDWDSLDAGSMSYLFAYIFSMHVSYMYICSGTNLVFFLCFAEMSSSYDLYKGMSRSKRKRKTPGESSQQPPKKSRTEEQSTAIHETASAVPEVEILETPRRVSSPPAQVFEEPEVVVQDEPLYAEEPMVEEAAQVFDGVIQTSLERV